MSPIARRIVMAALFLVALGFARLGIWQLSRLRERRAANVETIAARRAPAVPITADSARDRHARRTPRHGQGTVRRARVRSIVRGEAYEGTPGVRVVTPLLLADSGPAVLVVRGFLPAPDAVSADTQGTGEPGTRRGARVWLSRSARRRASRSSMPARRRGDGSSSPRCADGCPTLSCPFSSCRLRTAHCPRFPGGSSRRRSTRGRTWATRFSGSCSQAWRRGSRFSSWGEKRASRATERA